jgi:hypothetical protein
LRKSKDCVLLIICYPRLAAVLFLTAFDWPFMCSHSDVGCQGGRANSVRQYFAHFFPCCSFKIAPGTPNDIVCLCASEHLPCCTNCTEGFAIPLDIKGLIESKVQSVAAVAQEQQSTGAEDSSNRDERMVVVPTTEDGCNNEVPDSEIRSTEGFAIPLDINKGLIQSKAQSVAVLAQEQPTGAEEDSSNWDKMVVPITEDGCDEVPDSEIRSNDSSKGTSGAEQVDVVRMRGGGRGAATNNESLKEGERKIISHALADGHDDDVIVQVGRPSGHKVRRDAMQSLKPGVWVKDEVINAFFQLLTQRDGELCKNDVTQKRNGFFNSFFMTKLLNEGHSNRSRIGEYEYKNIRNWSANFVPGEDIFEVNKLFFPINVERTHWVLAVADILNQKIEIYDSGSRLYNYKSIGKNGVRCLQTIFRYLKDEHLDKKKTPLPNANRWQLIPCGSDTPQQQNGKFQSVLQEQNVYIFLFSSHIMI